MNNELFTQTETAELSDLLKSTENATGAGNIKDAGEINFNVNPETNPNAFMPQPPNGTALKMGDIINAELATELIDAVCPAIIAIGLKLAGYEINKTQLKATATEKKAIAPVLKQALDKITLNINNPFSALAITLGVIYGTKAVEIAATTPRASKAEKEEKNQEIKTIIEKVERARESKGMNKTEFSKFLGISSAQYSHFINGKSKIDFYNLMDEKF